LKTHHFFALALIAAVHAGQVHSQGIDHITPDSSEDVRQQALKHYRIGYELLKTRNYRNAAIEFEHATAIDTTYAEAFYLLGQSYAKLEEYDSAIDALERTRQLGMFRDRVAAKLAVMHQNSALTLYGQRKYREAIAAFEKSLELNPQNARALYNLGLCHNRLNDAASARGAFERAIEADPAYANPHKSLGDLHRAGHNHTAAAAAYRQAIAVDPDYAAAYVGLAQVHIATGDLDKALPMLQKAVQVDPQFADSYLLLGNVLIRLGRSGEAVQYLRKAISFTPQNPEAHYRLGEAYLAGGDHARAIAAANAALELRRDFHAVQVLLGDAHAKAGQVDQAVSWFTSAMKDSRFRDYCHHRIEELTGAGE
jgi:tetratricopeptide (TPR) repeat protein